MMSSTCSADTSGMSSRRKVLKSVVGAILQESGFLASEQAAVEILTEMLQSTLSEMGRNSRAYCELAYRTEPLLADVILAVIDMGLNLDGLQNYGRRSNRTVVTPPSQQIEQKPVSVLQVGDKKNHPSHIPDYLPPFPDTHTYIFSHTYKQPVTEYEAIREKSAAHKRDTEKALTKFAVKTSDTNNLFITDDKEYLLVFPKPNLKPYLDALMPRDQVFEGYEEPEVQRSRRRKVHLDESISEESPAQEKDTLNETQEIDADNPYLRPVKMPPKSRSKKF